MAEDRKKMLEALVAKRKAEAEGGGRLSHNSKSSPLSSKKTAPSVHKSSPLAHKPTTKPSPLLQQQKHHHQKKESPPKKKKKRVEKYDTEDDDDDDDEDESDEDSDSEEKSPVKKKVPSIKGGSAVKSSLKPSPFKGKPNTKEKISVKETPKGKRKSKNSSDEDDDDGASNEEVDEAAGTDSGDEGLDVTNILPGRTRRGTQPVHYDFTNMSGDDDDDSD